ncbi:heme peroxidase-related protein [Scenedesmus sp. NREL 46B-D3]|nr:heme peroxidase-related protein [Scenedesmus sp. NREL 46B-D3]
MLLTTGGTAARQAAVANRLAHRTYQRNLRLSSLNSMAASAEELRGQSCSLLGGCSSDTPTVPPDQLPQYLAALPGWQLAQDQGSISRHFVAKNFMAAVKFFNQAAEVAEEEGHHPDLHLTNYREVQVVLSTHAAGGLTMFDFVMAAKLDALDIEYSPKWLKQNQHSLAGGAAAAGEPAAAAPP